MPRLVLRDAALHDLEVRLKNLKEVDKAWTEKREKAFSKNHGYGFHMKTIEAQLRAVTREIKVTNMIIKFASTLVEIQ